MPTVEYDAFLDFYEERAGLDHSWAEYGAQGNWFGLPSHATKSADGAKLWALFGLRWQGPFGGIGAYIRRINAEWAEGVHESNVAIVFKLPLGAVTVQSAVLNYAIQVTGITGSNSVRLYGVKEPHYRDRWISSGYPATERAEFYSSVWGRPRRYKADSSQQHRRHTTAEVTWSPEWTQQAVYYQSADIASVLNEILSLPGWAYNNSLCLVMAPNWPYDSTDYNPDWSVAAVGGDSVRLYAYNSAYPPYLTITY